MFSPSPELTYVSVVLMFVFVIIDNVRDLAFSKRKLKAGYRMFILLHVLVVFLRDPIMVMSCLSPKLFFLCTFMVGWFIVQYNLFRFREYFEPIISRSEARVVDTTLHYVEEPIVISDGMFKVYAFFKVVLILEILFMVSVANFGQVAIEMGWL